MSEQGQSNYKGINAQAWAAMSLFLQYLRDPNFSYIQLEAPYLADFVLVFNDGHKIICESKDWKQKFSFSHLKKVLNSVLKKAIIGENDEILIICTNLDGELKEKVRNLKYFYKIIYPEFKRRKFTTQQIAIINKVKFWKVQQEDNHLIVYSLFRELLNFWLPEDELECKADSILIKKIYEGSARGAIFKREDIVSEIESMRERAIKYSGYFDDEKVKVEVQLHNLIKAIDNNKSPVWAPNQLKTLSSKPALMFFVLDRLKERKIDDLGKWKDLWQLYRTYRFSFSIFKIFESNLHTEENKKYILQFFKDNVSKIKKFYQQDFFGVDVVRITKKILQDDKNNRFIEDILEIAKRLISERQDDIFYLKAQRNDFWEREEMAKLLKSVYEKAKLDLKNEIYRFIVKTYNLIADEGEFSHYTPREVFDILRNWLNRDFEKRFLVLRRELSRQYDRFYKERFRFKKGFCGWELMGGTTSWWGDNYRVSDRHFIIYTLQPALTKYYAQTRNKEQVWKFIVKYCVHKTEEVKKEQPDFLNRTAIPIILKRYRSSNRKASEEALGILKEFILSRKGIPHKAELIYQEVRKDYPDNKKWELIKIIIQRYKIPTDPFVEQIVSGLAKKGNKEAKDIYLRWSQDPAYYKKTHFSGNRLISHIHNILDIEFNEAIKLFRNYISQDYFINKLDSFHAYKVAGLLGSILIKDFNAGIRILNYLRSQKRLTINQQILLCFSVLKCIENEEKGASLLIKLYSEFIDPLLDSFENKIEEIIKYIWHSNAREAFVQIAEKLVKQKLIKEALRIIEVFVNDPDPYLPGADPEDREGNYSHHKRIEDTGQPESIISSVRGWCAWVLAQTVILDARPYLRKIIKLTEKLIKDKDYYVKHMACFPLSRLVCYRLSHMPKNKNVLFFNDDLKTALKLAKKVEKIAFDFLDEITKCSTNVKCALAASVMSIFNCMRAISETKALTLIKKLLSFPDKVISEMTFILIYFAEFRKNDFKDWSCSLPGLYDDLKVFNDKKFKSLLNKTMVRSSETKAAFSWEFYRLTDSAKRKVKHSLQYDEAFNLSIKYLPKLISKYENRTFENIYRFIEDNMDMPGKFEKCYEIWQKCLETERPALWKLVKTEKLYEIYWWPFSHNGKILEKIYKEKGKASFLDAFEYLSEYPKEVYLGDIGKAVEILKKFPKSNKRVEKIFTNLIERDSKFYTVKQAWLRQ